MRVVLHEVLDVGGQRAVDVKVVRDLEAQVGRIPLEALRLRAVVVELDVLVRVRSVLVDDDLIDERAEIGSEIIKRVILFQSFYPVFLIMLINAANQPD